MRTAYITLVFLAVLVVSILGFRGERFTHPPADVFPEWLFPGMKQGRKIHPQEASAFFADGRADRLPPAHVVAASYGPAGQPLADDDHLYRGRAPDGSFARGFPASLPVTLALVQRGRDRFSIYCAPCHGAVGDGNGITKRYGMGATPSYHDDRIRSMAEGEIFNTITNGKGNMNPYADKLSARDRWAVIAYVRALQRARHATTADVPEAHRAELGLQ
jgi:cytochrome c553